MSDLEIEAARHAAVPYVDPESLSDPRGRRRRERDPTPLSESYATQGYLRGGEVVRPAGEAVEEPDVDGPGVRWIMTGWNASGAPATLRRQEQAQSALRARVIYEGGRIRAEGVTAAADRAWVEDHLVVTELPADVVVRVAVEHGQPAVIAETDGVLTVVPTGLRPATPSDDVERVSHAFVVEPAPTTCPMRVDDVPGARCVMRGGPWISASIHAAAIWTAHRRLLLARFGCGPCDNGSLPTLGPLGRISGARSMTEMTLPSRYGGWAWA